MADYSVTVLEIAYGENVPLSFYIGDFAGSDDICPVHPFSMTLVRGEGRNILIDTGIDTDDPVKQEILKSAGIGHAHSPREILETVGVTPEEITDVILTHAHFDHAGALDCYPNAQFYLQKRELLGWNEFLSEPKYTSLGIFSMDPADIKRLNALKEAGRLTLLDGDCVDVLPGISVAAGAFAHTFGMQIVLIETGQGLLVHCGDTANRPENLLGTENFKFYLPNTKFAVGSPYYAIVDYERLLEWSKGKLETIIMTHDGTRRERFPDSIGPLGLGIFRYC